MDLALIAQDVGPPSMSPVAVKISAFRPAGKARSNVNDDGDLMDNSVAVQVRDEQFWRRRTGESLW